MSTRKSLDAQHQGFFMFSSEGYFLLVLQTLKW